MSLWFLLFYLVLNTDFMSMVDFKDIFDKYCFKKNFNFFKLKVSIFLYKYYFKNNSFSIEDKYYFSDYFFFKMK